MALAAVEEFAHYRQEATRVLKGDQVGAISAGWDDFARVHPELATVDVDAMQELDAFRWMLQNGAFKGRPEDLREWVSRHSEANRALALLGL